MTVDTDAAHTPAAKSGSSPVFIAMVTVALVLSGVLIGVLISPTGRSTAAPAPNSVEVGFAQDMSVHHSQAIEMSAIALDRSPDAVVRNLAYDVLTTQQSQVGSMQGWLALWDRPALPSGASMAWMIDGGSMAGHSMDTTDAGAMSMPGMASAAELQTLRRMSGEEFDGMYLQLLRRHHRGGIPMAEYGAQNASVPAVTALARSITATQAAEVDQIDVLMSAHGVDPLPDR
ncbi:hypothetical protein CH263_06225 [Rhodococcus sp. 06-1059B-a]|nr:DUF305 domain-containing protein [Rhodococcus sp. 06-1059B-a]OZD70515.1 hypothetical protein CH263_06225 [Rhodococcus sp. 06-1059B-a]